MKRYYIENLDGPAYGFRPRLKENSRGDLVKYADAMAEIEALRTENALLSALLEPQKPMRADEVTEPGFYWWSQGGVVEIDIEYSTEHPKRLMLWSTGIEEGINLAGTFVGPLRMPEEV